MVGLWVEVGWIVEFTVVVFFIEGILGGLSNSDEVVEGKLVGEVLIKVVLEVLNQVHVLLDEIISSNSWEGESLIVELPGVDGDLWVLAQLFLHFLVDLHGLLVMFSVETS